MQQFSKIKSISELHRLMGVDKPKHPAISLVASKAINWNADIFNKNFIWDFYMISLKFHDGEFLYGREYYDFEEGTLVFTAPGQVIKSLDSPTAGMEEGWILYFHPDLLRNTNLGNKINEYTFFNYASNEALHLSEDEKQKVSSITREIEMEYSQNIDQHSQTLIVSNLELLLNHCTRFYDRQFYTRSKHQQDIIADLETYLKTYFDSDRPVHEGIPTVKQCAEKLNLSPNYLSDLLKVITGKNTQEHIHFFLIEKAKNSLLSTNSSISQVAYDLGFEYPQYFSNLFKKKTGYSPNEYRKLN